MTALDMDEGLVGIKGSRASLETLWKRYTTIIKAISKVGETDWEMGRKPADGEIIGVYGGKSVYYDQTKVLQYVRLHPEMVQWLERSDIDADEDASALWGYYKTLYALKDLEKWLDEKQKQKQETKVDWKGKMKATVQLRNQKGKRGDDGDGDNSSSPPPSKIPQEVSRWSKIVSICSVWKSSPGTAKKPRPDWTLTD
jgi:hypothetical protein